MTNWELKKMVVSRLALVIKDIIYVKRGCPGHWMPWASKNDLYILNKDDVTKTKTTVDLKIKLYKLKKKGLLEDLEKLKIETDTKRD